MKVEIKWAIKVKNSYLTIVVWLSVGIKVGKSGTKKNLGDSDFFCLSENVDVMHEYTKPLALLLTWLL